MAAPAVATETVLRAAVATDLPALVRIEERAFQSDRFSRRTFRYLLSRARAVTVVAERPEVGIVGYATVTFNRGTSLARLYSIAVDPEQRGRGLGDQLLAAAEAVAREHAAAYMRLEARADAPALIAFYRAHGYRPFAIQHHYYQDAADAVRMQKALATPPDPLLARVPYYAQSLDFTCGPAALLMAMRALDASVRVDRAAELRIWRESTTVFMTAGHGGCGPEGLALAARRRGFAVELFLGDEGIMFLAGVRDPRKREVIRVVHEDFRAQIAGSGVQVSYRPLSLETTRAKFNAGGIPLVLTSTYRFDREKQPHWLVITGFDDRYVYVHDPNADIERGKTLTDCMQIPVAQSDFVKMARYGKAQQQATLIIAKEPA